MAGLESIQLVLIVFDAVSCKMNQFSKSVS